MKKTLWTLALLTVAFVSCTENGANGERVGVITTFSNHGILWRSWEGHLNSTQTGMNSSEGFDFSIDNDSENPQVIAVLDSALRYGWKVRISYHVTVGKNWFHNRGTTNCFVTNVEVVDKNLTHQFQNSTN